MRAGSNRILEAVVAIALLGAVVTVYAYVAKLLQGVYIMEDWTGWVRWVIGDTSDMVLQQYIPVALLWQLGVAIMLVYIIGFKRQSIWMWAASHKLPKWFTSTWLTRILERYLTDDYKLQRDAIKHIPSSVSNTATIVDIGCGGAAYLDRLPSYYKIGLDANPQRLEIARKYCNEVQCLDLSIGLDGVQGDIALCFEVIEHLEEEQGVQLLQSLERFPVVILTTPHTWFEVCREGHERHLSFWSAERMAEFGYKLVGRGRIPPSNIYLRGG